MAKSVNPDSVKVIQNRKTSIPSEKEGVNHDYFTLIKACTNRPPQGGFSREEMRLLIDIDVKLIGKEATLSSTEARKIWSIVDDYKWPIKHPDIIEFTDYLESVLK